MRRAGDLGLVAEVALGLKRWLQVTVLGPAVVVLVRVMVYGVCDSDAEEPQWARGWP